MSRVSFGDSPPRWDIQYGGDVCVNFLLVTQDFFGISVHVSVYKNLVGSGVGHNHAAEIQEAVYSLLDGNIFEILFYYVGVGYEGSAIKLLL